MKKKLLFLLLGLIMVGVMLFSGVMEGSYAKGLKALEKGDWETASSHLAKAVKQKQSPEVYLAYSKALIAQGDYVSAESVAKEAIIKLKSEHRVDFACDIIDWVLNDWKGQSITELSCIFKHFSTHWLSNDYLIDTFATTPDEQLYQFFSVNKNLFTISRANFLLNQADIYNRPELIEVIVSLQPDTLIQNLDHQQSLALLKVLNNYKPADSQPRWLKALSLHEDIILSWLKVSIDSGDFINSTPWFQYNSELSTAIHEDSISQFCIALASIAREHPFDQISTYTLNRPITSLLFAPDDSRVLVWTEEIRFWAVHLYIFSEKSSKQLATDNYTGYWSPNGNKFALLFNYDGPAAKFTFYSNDGTILSTFMIDSLWQAFGWVDNEKLYGISYEASPIFISSKTGHESTTHINYYFYPSKPFDMPGKYLRVVNSSEAWWAFPAEEGKFTVAKVNKQFSILDILPGLWSEEQLETLSMGDSVVVWAEGQTIKRAKYK